jgi:hypothetical protein
MSSETVASSTPEASALVTKTVAELRNILPTIDETELRAHVVAAGGNFNEALKLAMSSPAPATESPHSIFSFFPKETTGPNTSSLDSNGAQEADLESLKAKYGKQLENTKSAVGAGYDDLQILVCFEKYQGDVKKAVAELMGNHSRSLERSQLSMSRESLRQSASALRASKSALSRSTGIEELPLNLSFSLFDSKADDLQIPTKLPPLMRPGDVDSDESGSSTSSTSASSSSEPSKAPISKATPKAEPSKPVDLFDAILAPPMPVAPRAPAVVRVVDKSELSDKSIDKDALAEFLRNQGGASQDSIVAAQAARQISYDDYVVVAHALLSLRQFQAARKLAMSKTSSAAPQKGYNRAITRKSEDARRQVDLDMQKALQNAGPGGSEEGIVDSRPSPVSCFDLTEFANAQVEMGVDIASSAEMCAEYQDNEIRELEAILTAERVQTSDSQPKIVLVSLTEPEFEFTKTMEDKSIDAEGGTRSVDVTARVSFKNPLCLVLIAVLPPLYPECSPLLSVRSMSRSCPLTPADFERFEAHLNQLAKENAGMPCLFSLVQAADEFTLEDEIIRETALKLQAKDQTLRFSPFGSLKLLFSFQTDATFHRFEDILNQRNKVVQRAIKFLINGPKATGQDPPVQVSSKEDFPILNLAGDVDITASLRLIGLSPASVRVLVQSFDWKLEAFSAAYLESLSNGTYLQFLKSNGVVAMDESQIANSSSAASASYQLMEDVECPTCFCDVPKHQTFTLSCGHFQCISCYCEFAEVNSASGGTEAFTCPSPGCKFLVDPISVVALLSAKRWASYCSVLVSHFVATNKEYSWCPSTAGCDYVVQTADLGSKHEHAASSSTEVTAAPTGSEVPLINKSIPVVDPTVAPSLIQCVCATTYCSRCKRPGGHFPATCSEMSEWDRLFPDDMHGNSSHEEELTRKALKSISRCCPSCGSAISKSGGCPHMVCRMCGHEFCWACFANWSTKHYSCDQSEIAITDEAGYAQFKVHPILSILSKHRNGSYDVTVTLMKEKLMEAMYRPDVDPFAKSKVHVHSTSKSANLDNLITFSDVEHFIAAWELMHVSHYLVTHATKAAYVFSVLNAPSNWGKNRLSSTVNRVIQDMIFLADVCKTQTYRKELVFHLGAAQAQLKTSVRLMLDHFNYLRMQELAQLV